MPTHVGGFGALVLYVDGVWQGVVVAVDDHHGGDWCTMLQLDLFTCHTITQKIFLAVHFTVCLYKKKIQKMICGRDAV